jgi:alkylation response protein AidB-like acyl-CoA dehydrogenase
MTEQITIDEFRAAARAFLDSHCEPKVEESFVWGRGSDRVGMFEERTPVEEQRKVDAAKAWRGKLFDAGFGWITGPVEYGGRGLGAPYQRAWLEEASSFRTGDETPFTIGLGMVAPTILAHAVEETRRAYLRSLWRGDVIACQLFSEPVAGSDLAGIQTRAERDGDEWVLTGQKVWTSGAQFSDIGEIITRTSPDKPKHKGLTIFLVDMHAPGVEVRPLRQMTGGASFNEVFFEEVRVPDSHRLGDVDEGWSVALTTLMNERMSIGTGMGSGGGTAMGSFTRLVAMAKHFGTHRDPVVRQKLADLYAHTTASRWNNLRGLARIKAGQTPGPEMSIAKLAGTLNGLRTSALLSDLLGPRLVADSGEWGTFAWSELVLGIPGARIAGGTDEVMRNILGERVLGLPKDPSHPR